MIPIVGGQGGGGLTTQQVESIIKAFGEKLFLNKTKPDQTSYLIKFLGGLFSDYIQSMNFSSGALGEGFVMQGYFFLENITVLMAALA